MFCNFNVPIPQFKDKSLRMETSLTGKRLEHFMQMLCTEDFSIPISTNWALLIEMPSENFLREIADTAKSFNPNPWQVDDSIKRVMIPAYQEIIGCIFAQGIVIPGSDSGITFSTTGKQSFMSSPLLEKRNDNSELEVSFLETNTSFTDFFLRPWWNLVQYKGLVARPKESSVKCKFKLFQFKKTQEDLQSGIRKVVVFNNVVPSKISNESLKYDIGSNNDLFRQANFSYSDFTIIEERY